MKGILFFSAAALILLSAGTSTAGYPMISDIPNQKIMVNASTGTIKFNVTDDKTLPSDLTLSYRSNNTDLVPEDDSNIILGGSGANRTVKIIPESDKWGIATITVIVIDTDSETNQDSLQVEVTRPPR